MGIGALIRQMETQHPQQNRSKYPYHEDYRGPSIDPGESMARGDGLEFLEDENAGRSRSQDPGFSREFPSNDYIVLPNGERVKVTRRDPGFSRDFSPEGPQYIELPDGSRIDVSKARDPGFSRDFPSQTNQSIGDLFFGRKGRP